MDKKRKGSSSDNQRAAAAGSSSKKAKTSANGTSTSAGGNISKSKFNKETFLKSVKDLKLYVDGIMNWHAEARALIEDMQHYVHKIEISREHESNDMRIYFNIETLERDKLIVSMDSNGFRICDRLRQGASGDSVLSFDDGQERQNSASKELLPSSDATPIIGFEGREEEARGNKVYETINALLDSNSPKYRVAFAQALMERIKSIE